MAVNSDAVRGRVHYIEPTNIAFYSDGTKSIVQSNDLMFNSHEDYSIAVDLEVKVPNRKACSLAQENGDYIKLNYSSTKGTVSFMNGTDGVLTTNFTDIDLVNPTGNTRECLGIESISIEYNSWQYPQVTIKFVDVRGASVMLQEEGSKLNGTTFGSFYRALFTLPSPLFVLKVKGFYGKGVTYYLAEQSVDLDMEAEGGNFNITAKFIGYMYRIYTDVPMTFLCAAPYMNGGAEYWAASTEGENGRFRFINKDGTTSQMMKFPDLRKRIAAAALSEEMTSAAAHGEQVVVNNDEKISKLTAIRATYPLEKWYFSEGNGYYYASSEYSSENQIVSEIDSFITAVSGYDATYGTQYLGKFEGIRRYASKKVGGGGANIEKYVYTATPGKKKELEVINDSTPPDVKDYIINAATKSNKTNIFVIRSTFPSEKEFVAKGIEKEILNVEKEKEDLKKEYQALADAAMEKALGFSPTIENVYNLVFAHMDTFMHVFFESMDAIKAQLDKNAPERMVDYFSTAFTDLPSDEKQVPPFPAFYKEVETTSNEKKRELQWLEEVYHGDTMEEVDFVKNLINATSIYANEDSAATEYIKRLKTGDDEGESNNKGSRKTGGSGGSERLVNAPDFTINDLVPITTYDLANRERINNPYAWIKGLDESNKIQDGKNFEYAALGTFALRCLYYLWSNKPKNNEADTFGKLEAMNFVKAFGENYCTDKFFEFLDRYADDKREKREAKEIVTMLSSVASPDNRMWDIEQKRLLIESDNEIRFGLINWGGNSIYPIGENSFANIKAKVPGASSISELYSTGKYIPESRGFDIGENAETVRIIDSRDYINEVYKSIAEECGKYGISNGDLKQFKDNIDPILDKKEDQTFVNKCIYSIEEEKPLNGNRILDMLNGGYIEQEDYYIKYATMIDEERTDSLFDEDYYKWQKDIKSKAYLFLSSIPVKGKESKNNSSKAGTNAYVANGVELKVTLLREGSFYWREDILTSHGCDNSYDPIRMGDENGDKYIHAAATETYMGYKHSVNNKETLNPMKIDSKRAKYVSFNKPEGYSASRRRVLKKLFEDWAQNEFGAIEHMLTDASFYVNGSFKKGFDGSILKNSSTDETKKFNARKIQAFLRNVYFGAVTVLDYYAKSSKNYSIFDDGFTANKAQMIKAFKSFMDTLEVIYKKRVKEGKDAMMFEAERKRSEDPYNNKDLKLATYMVLKSMYDKWLCAPLYGRNTWVLGKKESDFNRFNFIDSFYHYVGNALNVNITKVGEWISQCMPTQNIQTIEGEAKYHGKSLYEFLADTAQHTGGMLMAFPHRIGSQSINTMTDMFRAIPEIGDWETDESSFVFIYTYKPSENSGGGDFDDDGFDIPSEETTELFSDVGYDVPAFGVTYAKQNQSFFKNITLNTESPAITEASITATMAIAAKGSEGARETNLFGQDLYRIKSSYSYNCEFDMMGCMQITPLMYFQLNNVPFWRGAYMVYKVSHQITNGDATTHVTGIRINKYAIPLASSMIIGTPPLKRNGGAGGGGDYDGLTERVTGTEAGKNEVNISGDGTKRVVTEDFDLANVSEEKPIICLTPAHGPKTKKPLEWLWSCKLIDDYIIPKLKQCKFYDGTSYESNIQRCNKPKNGDPKEIEGAYSTGYNTREVMKLIDSYGSKKVIAITPHWNGTPNGAYHATFNGYVDESGAEHYRSDSLILTKCFNDEADKMLKRAKNHEFHQMPEGMWKTNRRGKELLGQRKTDTAAKMNCGSVLTENLFADYGVNGGTEAFYTNYNNSKNDVVFDEAKGRYISKEIENGTNTGWRRMKDGNIFAYGAGWLFSDEGLNVISELHVQAIRRYINNLHESDPDLMPLGASRSSSNDNDEISDAKWNELATNLGVEVAALKAIKEVESGGRKAVEANGWPPILFEGHVFWGELKKAGIDPNKYVTGNENILYPKWTKAYYSENQLDRLLKAAQIHEEAAIASASYGLFQIMGFNYEIFGLNKPSELLTEMKKGAERQMELLGIFLKKNTAILTALKNKDWAAFAERYNGPRYKENNYDTKLASAYNKLKNQ